MILDNSATKSMAQQAADISGMPQTVYQRKDGSFIFCAKGNVEGLKMALKPNESIGYIATINPSAWPKEEKDA